MLGTEIFNETCRGHQSISNGLIIDAIVVQTPGDRQEILVCQLNAVETKLLGCGESVDELMTRIAAPKRDGSDSNLTQRHLEDCLI